MHSSNGAGAAGWVLPFGLVVALGCTDGRPEPGEERPEPAQSPAALFNPRSAGTVQGRVVWQGDVPVVRPFRIPPALPGPSPAPERLEHANPNAPVVGRADRGVGNAVVFLRGVDPGRSRPWDHAPVRVEQSDYRFQVRQGELNSRYGFVRRGDRVEMVSHQAAFHSLHAGGAAFFTLTFAEPDHPRSRRLDHNGVVELTSAAGYFWMRAYLFVDEHPYYARTDATGRFTLPQVPPGRYELVCWMPSWREARRDFDPESGKVLRLHLQPPAEQARRVTVRPGDTSDVEFVVAADAFSG
jgi:hypothetical protein